MTEDTRLEIVRRLDYIDALLPVSGVMPDARTRIMEHLRWIKDEVTAPQRPVEPPQHEGPESPRAELD